MDSSAPSGWSTLHRDILEAIIKRLDCTRTQIFSLRAVCSGWRSIIPIPPNRFSPNGSTLKLPLPINIRSKNAYNVNQEDFFLLKEVTTYCVEPVTEVSRDPKSSTNYWFAKIEETESGKVRLTDPVCRWQIKNFSDINRRQQRPSERCNDHRLTGVINLLDYRVTEVAKTYDVVGISFQKRGELRPVNSLPIKKFVVGYDNKGKVTVMALLMNWRLKVWKTGDNQWAMVSYTSEKTYFRDISYHNGRFYSVDLKNCTIAVDPSSLEVTIIVPPKEKYILNYDRCLLNSLGDLYLIHQRLTKVTSDFRIVDSDSDYNISRSQVYKLNEEQGKWISVESLGNQIMFVGECCCFSVSATEFAVLKGNGIFFLNELDGFRSRHGELEIWNASSSDWEDQTTADPLKPVVGCFRSLWPPPAWLKIDGVGAE